MFIFEQSFFVKVAQAQRRFLCLSLFRLNPYILQTNHFYFALLYYHLTQEFQRFF